MSVIPVLPQDPHASDVPRIRFAEVLSALSFALDLTEGQPAGHSVRSCVMAMSLAQKIGLPAEDRSDLYYATLIKDAGCSANASKMTQILGTDDITAKRDALVMDWSRTGWESLQYALSHVRTGAPFLERVRALFEMAAHQKENAKLVNQLRCDRGASIARTIGLSEPSATGIQCLNEHWNGLGQPQGLRGAEIPMLSRIMCLVQTADFFHCAKGRAAAVDIIRKRSGHWFDPALAEAFCSLASRETLWIDVENAPQRVTQMEPRQDLFDASDVTLDRICLAFAEVIDAKSPFTYRHSTGVARAAVAIAQTLSMSEPEVNLVRRSALLHDIGKLGVSNTILDKPDKLTDSEWASVKNHPRYSHEILNRIPGFSDLSEIAASHHEKLDGSGYFRNYSAPHLSMPARILVVADVFDALSAKRPYRDALPLETVFKIMEKDVPRALDGACFEALKLSAAGSSGMTQDLFRLASTIPAAVPVEQVSPVTAGTLYGSE